jgi:hypothetical protein
MSLIVACRKHERQVGFLLVNLSKIQTAGWI